MMMDDHHLSNIKNVCENKKQGIFGIEGGTPLFFTDSVYF
jgi:hypothetical protein